MDNYNVLVLMEKNSSTGYLTETVDSYTISEGMEFVESIYMLRGEEADFIYLTLTTKDVEDWEYYGIYELYDEELFNELIDELQDGSGEYNPRWILKLKYSDNRLNMEDVLNSILKAHIKELSRIQPLLEEGKQEYLKAIDEENEEADGQDI